jgi:cytochrome c oxidase subunit 3
MMEMNTVRTPKGRAAMWWMVASEAVIFGGFIACYLLYRIRHPEWSAVAEHTSAPLGILNTFILLASGFFMAQASRQASKGNGGGAALQIVLTILLALGFLTVKGWEYSMKIEHGNIPGAHLFWDFYFGMTGLHGLHIVAGILAMIFIAIGAKRGNNLGRVEMVGLYWYLVDVVWVFIFALLYLDHFSRIVVWPAAACIAGLGVYQFMGLKRESRWFQAAVIFAVICLGFFFFGVYPDIIPITAIIAK